MSNNQVNKIIEKVQNLINAENNGDSKIADSILSNDFIAITRSSGKEENRDKLLLAIEKGKSDLEEKRKLDQDYFKIRELDKEHVKVIDNGKIAVSRSLITLKEKGQDDKIYRNIHVFENVFENEDGNWLCKIWQVTELKNLKEIVD